MSPKLAATYRSHVTLYIFNAGGIKVKSAQSLLGIGWGGLRRAAVLSCWSFCVLIPLCLHRIGWLGQRAGASAVDVASKCVL